MYLKELPKNINNWINLRHLEIDGNSGLTFMPCGLGELTMLQTLPLFFVGNNSRNSSDKRIGRLNELKCINSLRGELAIARLSKVRGGALDSKEANLKGKQCLHSLRLYWLEPIKWMIWDFEPERNNVEEAESATQVQRSS